MGSPLSPILADIIMDDLETHCINSLDFEIQVYYRYVDDIFLVLPEDRLQEVLNTFNSYHPRLQFTSEIENNKTLNFLNVSVLRENNKMITNWYRKPTFSGRYINYFSSHPTKYKINTITTLVDQAILLSDARFHNSNIKLIQDILLNNSYPPRFINEHITKRLKLLRHRHNTNTNDPPTESLERKNYLTIPYINGISEEIGRILSKFNMNIVFTVPKKLDVIIRKGKDKIINTKQTELVYKIDCINCDATYIGQTKRHIATRIKEHCNDIKKPTSNHSVVSKHRTTFGHEFDWSNPLILHKERHYRRREIAEMFFIKKFNNTINLQKDTENLNTIYDKIVRLT
ncbi:PREDICTED: uncharacterized protein LOC105558604 [Vollenhovia emeryi]|uniref:uncharacterized protein LOC105558604 n=1 Tax=Vollenhovia emeryi TaxID=411798 RepID=UPI0005F385E6|nr:PREDICTED: uncharacterized protein LOC105558604 [Vollenhovia emeryi]